MKKVKAILAAVLIVVTLLSCCIVNAESCYVALRELMNSKDQENWYMGKGKSSATDAGKEIYAVYVEKDEAFYIVGVNEYGEGEITIWNNVEMLRGYFMIYSLCGIWDILQDNIDPGYSITLGITEMEQIEGDWVIDDADSAASFAEVMNQTFSSLGV